MFLGENAMSNLFNNMPAMLPIELTETLVDAQNVRIERIVSQGHKSELDQWYDQDEHEWVLLLQGAAQLFFEDGEKIVMQEGDYVNITAHRRHRVNWTSQDEKTVWLAVFYC